MKRSRSVRLTLMGAVTAGGLSACGDGIVAPGHYTDVSACTAAGNSNYACTRAQKVALASHQVLAPRFKSREECLERIDVTECLPARLRNADGTSSDYFVPRVAGFVLTQQTGQRGGTGGGGSVFYASRDYPSQYRDADNLSGSRSVTSSAPGRPVVSTPARPPNIRTTTVSRGGFGSTSGVHGSGSS